MKSIVLDPILKNSKIIRLIVGSNFIDVMNDNVRRQKVTERLFSNKNMLSNIPTTYSAWMSFHHHTHVAIVNRPLRSSSGMVWRS